MFKAFIALLILLIVCWVIQLLPVIAVPFTTPDANIYLSYYNNYKFGYLGYVMLNDIYAQNQVLDILPLIVHFMHMTTMNLLELVVLSCHQMYDIQFPSY